MGRRPGCHHSARAERGGKDGIASLKGFLVQGGTKAGSRGEERKGTTWLAFHCNLNSTLSAMAIYIKFMQQNILPCVDNLDAQPNTLYLAKDIIWKLVTRCEVLQ